MKKIFLFTLMVFILLFMQISLAAGMSDDLEKKWIKIYYGKAMQGILGESAWEAIPNIPYDNPSVIEIPPRGKELRNLWIDEAYYIAVAMAAKLKAESIRVGPGNGIVRIFALYDGLGIKDDSKSQAKLLIEVFVEETGKPVPNTDVVLTTTMGTLANTTVTTDSQGMVSTTLTSGGSVGTAYITATVGLYTAGTTVPIMNNP